MTNESVDERIRQALDALTEAPPPGSDFDAEALWKTLHAELHPKPRRRGAAWWVAAGVVLGLLGAGAYWLKPAPDPPLAPASVAVRRSQPATARSSRVPAMKSTEILVKAVPARPPSLARRKSMNLPPPAAEPEAEPVSLTVPPPVSEPVPVAELAAEVPTRKAVPAPPRPRFRVVHANELRAEEEARPKLYRTEGMVRVVFGTPQSAGTPPSESVKSVTFSTKSKPIP